ncbi:MAG: hypothetical protein GT598_15695 [Bacteroidales bacterium]|nr:hypothetical protein [Bacteroidales bacterium]
MYWTEEHQQLIVKYYWSYTSSTSAHTRNECVKGLIQPLITLTKKALHQMGVTVDDDNVQNCLIFQTTYLLPKLNEKKLKGVLQYLWISTKRYIITYMLLPKKNKYYHNININNYEITDTVTNNADYEVEKKDLRIMIIDVIDRKIARQRVINKTNTIFLSLMREYILENDFDVAGFDVYVMEKMNINISTYRSLMSRCKIRSKLFNKKIISN